MLHPIPDLSRECPIDALPDLLYGAACEIRQLEDDVPAECLLTDAVAASVAATQRLYDVQGLDYRVMPTTVNTLALAPSGSGKGTSYREFFKPLVEHNQRAQIVSREIRNRKRLLKEVGLPADGPEFREPDGRILTTISYRALMDCLDGVARSVSINHEDGFSFLESDLFTEQGDKITQLYSGFPDLTYMVKDVDLIAVGGRCSVGVRLQGDLFYPDMKRTHNRSFHQGIWGRAIVACFDPKRFGTAKVLMPAKSPGGGLTEFYRRLERLLEEADKKQARGKLVRDKLILGKEAKAFMHELKFRLKGWRQTYYAAIEPAAARAWENTLRIAAVFQVVCEGGNEIALEMAQRAWVIVQWSLTQHQMIFVDAIKPEPKLPAVRAAGPFAKPWPAKLKLPKQPRPIQDARWVLDCLHAVSGGRGEALLAEVATLAGLRGPRLETALAWLKVNQAVEIVGRGENAVMRIPPKAAISPLCAFPSFS
ncbi:TPA: DUF3987 domain-containing protein [Stenotrophomonas maltophilia]